ncbi:hypothetical protein GCM10007112_16760 [Vulcanisaeta souniana JCM 11219]|nr:hypothetical protein GCM10007112_16760 [Vulcanisaeta souniana JCM 11219]
MTFSVTIGTGNYSISIGVYNGTAAIEVVQGKNVLMTKIITGPPFNYVVTTPAPSYAFLNFESTDQQLQVVVARVNGTPLLAFNVYRGYISNYTASMITLPPQFTLNLGPTSTPVNTGISFILRAPNYTGPTPLAIWVGEGFSNQSGYWWAQIGFNDWNGYMNVSYAGWGVFSSFYPNVGGTDYNYSLLPGHTYNFTMALVSGTTWEFLVNGTLIAEENLTGIYNLGSPIANMGADLGFETLTAWGGSINITNVIDVPVAMSFRIGSAWVETTNLTLLSVGENWWNGKATSAPGISVWGLEGNLQNSSICQGELIFADNLSKPFQLPGLSIEPFYGTFYFSPKNTTIKYADLTVENNGSIYVKPRNGTILVSIVSFPENQLVLGTNNQVFIEGIQNLVLSSPGLINNPFRSSGTAILIVPLSSAENSYGNPQEIVLLQRYNVTFVESGLPAGTSWSVTLNGIKVESNSSTVTFYELDGLYYYNIGPIEGFTVSPSTGFITVNDSNTIQTVTFKLITYNVTFTESGLPNGTPWSATLNGTTKTSTTGSINFTVTPGPYTYQVGLVNGYTASPGSGSITVGGNETVPITFTPTTATTNRTVTTTSTSQTMISWVTPVIIAVVIVIAIIVILILRRRERM